MKSESLVIVDQNATVNTVPGLVHTARHTMGVGCKRATMVGTKGCDAARWSQSQKTGLSSDWSLQLDFMKVELLVIADQHAAVNTFPGLVHTARQARKAGYG